NRLLWVQAAKSRLRLETTAKNFRQRCMGDSFAGTALLSLLMPVLGLPGLPEIEPTKGGQCPDQAVERRNFTTSYQLLKPWLLCLLFRSVWQGVYATKSPMEPQSVGTKGVARRGKGLIPRPGWQG